jgi:hypothetical protein
MTGRAASAIMDRLLTMSPLERRSNGKKALVTVGVNLLKQFGRECFVYHGKFVGMLLNYPPRKISLLAVANNGG